MKLSFWVINRSLFMSHFNSYDDNRLDGEILIFERWMLNCYSIYHNKNHSNSLKKLIGKRENCNASKKFINVVLKLKLMEMFR